MNGKNTRKGKYEKVKQNNRRERESKKKKQIRKTVRNYKKHSAKKSGIFGRKGERNIG
jgi:hypothetical protein